jgi:hypothetical protein
MSISCTEILVKELTVNLHIFPPKRQHTFMVFGVFQKNSKSICYFLHVLPSVPLSVCPSNGIDFDKTQYGMVIFILVLFNSF